MDLFGCVDQSNDETVVVPNLYIRIAYKLFCLRDSFTIVAANHLIALLEATVASDGICSILEQRPAEDAGFARGDVGD
jgi:hypothetical protein